ncbi:MAG: HD-GYP domain-containing protein [Firmicutes bacterium]|nr:HD-GYP domain-containing protein [Bacillota bacterium]
MRLIPIENVKPGMKLARAVFRDQDGKVLLRPGVVIKPSYIQKFKELQYQYLYIMDPGDEEQTLADLEPIKEETLFQARGLVKKYFTLLKQNKNINIDELKGVITDIVDQIIRNPNVVYNMLDIRTHDNYTYAHSVNVCIISVMVGVALNLNRRQLETLGIGALMHDIGKILIDNKILNKPDKLEPEESELIKKHARDGYELLKKKADINFLSSHVVFQHHEREDGSGYPRGLTGKRIHRFSKIVAVVDTYDAMTSNRSYREEITTLHALAEIKQEAARKFDSNVVEAFLRVVAPYPIGSTLLFKNGQKAIVKSVSRHECLVEVIEGSEMGNTFNLYHHPNLEVDKVFFS